MNLNNVIMVCSYGVASTGLNIPNLNNLIIAAPTKSKTRILQSIGRILRKAENKKRALVFDIADDLSYGKENAKMNYALKHFMERYNHYLNEGFPVIMNTIEL